MSTERERIVILGGGLSGMSAAFWLSEEARLTKREYEITVYQPGWRLGGKCASGRNAGAGQRIEEHGLHVWFGMYENAFRTIRRAYEAVNEQTAYSTFKDWRDAFAPQDVWTLEQRIVSELPHWGVFFPPNRLVPGGETTDAPMAAVEADRRRALRRNLWSWVGNAGSVFATGDGGPIWRRPVGSALRAAGLVATAAGTAISWSLDELASIATGQPHRPGWRNLGPAVLRALADRLHDDLGTALGDAEAERVRVISDLVATLIIGMAEDRLEEVGWESVDGEEFGAWLRRHGAHESTVASPLLSQIYDVAFAYARGNQKDLRCRNVAAGTGARGIWQFLFGYKGAFEWEMQAGMGDTVFTPIYAVLKHRGVRFKFFHRVRSIELSNDRRFLDRICLGRQVTLKDPAVQYEPLVRVKGLDCWPNAPRYDQIVEADRLRAHLADHPNDLEAHWSTWPDVENSSLEQGRDFDRAVLAIPVSCLGDICEDLVKKNVRWRAMVDRLESIPTYAVQLWLRRTTAEFGWQIDPTQPWFRRRVCAGRPLGTDATLCGFDPDLNTWADFSHLIAREDYPPNAAPKSIAYFCGAFDDEAFRHPDLQGRDSGRYRLALAEIRGLAQKALTERMRPLWSACDPGLTSDDLVGSSPDRFDDQSWRVNVDPTERYVLSLSGTTDYRIPGWDSGVENLYLAGDWTRNGVLSMGCVEGAMTSGAEAAIAIVHGAHDTSAMASRLVAWRDPLVSGRWSAARLDVLRQEVTPDLDADSLIAAFFAPDASTAARGAIWEALELRKPFPFDPQETLRKKNASIAAGFDATRIERGQCFFERHRPEILMILACYSLPGAYAANNGVHVLGSTRYLVAEPARRLAETASMVISVMGDTRFRRGDAVAAVTPVRLLHAAIRYMLLHRKSDPWNRQTLGTPLNQEDLLGTLMSFYWVTIDGLRKLGFDVCEGEKADYLEVWRAVGAMLGIRRDLLPDSFAEATLLTRVIQARQIRPRDPNPDGRLLTTSLVDMIDLEVPGDLLDGVAAAMVRFFLSDYPGLADALGVPRRILWESLVPIGLRFVPALSTPLLRTWATHMINQQIRTHLRQPLSPSLQPYMQAATG